MATKCVRRRIVSYDDEGNEIIIVQSGSVEMTEAEVNVRASANADTVDEVKARKQSEINEAATIAIMNFHRGIPQWEVDTYPYQKAEAEAWTADNTAPTPSLDILCARRGLELSVLVAKVLNKAGLYRDYVFDIEGSKHRLEDQLDAAYEIDGTDEEKIAAINAIVVEMQA